MAGLYGVQAGRGGPMDDAKEPIIMTAITTIRLNKWEHPEISSYSDQIGSNEIKMPINPVLIATARFAGREKKKKRKGKH